MEYFTISLESIDNHIFSYSCLSRSEKEAIDLALKKIIDNGWEHHQYKIKNIKKTLK